MLNVALYQMKGHRRSQMCVAAMSSGIAAAGDRPQVILDEHFKGVTHDACVFYGYTTRLQRIMAAHIAAGRPAVYLDLGYWHREGSNGHHKIVVNGRHPTAYFQARRHDASRLRNFRVEIKPWRRGGRSILLAGMGFKAATIAEGVPFESFERQAILELRRHTARPIVYRPKPSCKESRPITGTVFSPREESLDAVLADCHAVVTHHSNVAVDALVAGIPAFCWQGVAAPLSLQDFARIESPAYPDGREQWLADIAWTQWSIAEMAAGLPWRHLKHEGLLP